MLMGVQGDVLEWLKPMIDDIQVISKVDGKPEKGERKIVDELVILVSDILDEYLTEKPSQPLHLLKVAILEQAYD